MRKVCLITAAYALIAFAVCLAVSFVYQNVPELLPGAKTSYLINRGVIFFLNALPSLIFCGFLVGSSISYGRDSNKAQMKYSKVIITHFKKTIIIAAVFVIFLTFVQELFLPMFTAKQNVEEQKPAAFNEYITLADSSYKEGKMEQAFEYSSNALRINPKDQKALWLKEHSKAERNSMKGVEDIKEEAKFVYIPLNESDGETVYSLMQKAEKAKAEEKWFDAHYYAYLAVNISDGRDINLTEAQRLVSEAWNHLFDTKVFEENEEQALFKKKRAAYMSMINGDNVEAYYKFHEISQSNDYAARDPDVMQFLNITEKRVSNDCFFIEETEDLKRFETAKDVYFAITHDDGTKDVVYIKGVTPVKNVGKMVQYLREFKLYKFDAEGQLEMVISTPYAKMLSVATDTFNKETKQEFDIKDEYQSVPKLMLESISQDSSNIRNFPEYEFDASREKAADENKNYFILSISVDDFNILCDSGIDPDKMNLMSLMKLLPKAHDYGFAPEILTCSFLNRVTYPFFILLVFMVLACFSWDYRVTEQLFKFKWIFIMPFASALVFAITGLLLCALKFLNFALISVAGDFAIIVSAAILVILLFASCITFLSKTV